MNESEKINDRLLKLFVSFKTEIMANRKRFYLSDLEEYILNKLDGANAYTELGGYQSLYHLIKEKEKEDEIKVIKSSPYNGRSPALKSRWQLIEKKKEEWDKRVVFRLSSHLDLGYYLKRPEKQTEEPLNRIKKIYNFLVEKDEREWSSKEERALELFDDEKFLDKKPGRKFISRLKLSLKDLKAEKYSKMFVYWKKGFEINKILILENHSAFIACKRALSEDIPIFSFSPDTLIYGAGKHIIKSLGFMEEIADIDQVEIYYAGDIDPSGFMIYHSIIKKYPGYDLKLFKRFYWEMMVREEWGYPVETDQQRNKDFLETILAEFKKRYNKVYPVPPDICRGLSGKNKDPGERLKYLWKNNLRIPQEVITYEVLKRNHDYPKKV